MIKNYLFQKNLSCQIVYCEGNVCTDISTNSEMPNISLEHTEADTMMITIYAIIRQNHPELSVVIDSEDTDVYVQAAYVAHKIPGDLLIKRKNRFVNCRALVDEDISDIIIAAYCISGCDHTPGLYGHGKKQIMKKPEDDAEAKELLASVGSSHLLMRKHIIKWSSLCLQRYTDVYQGPLAVRQEPRNGDSRKRKTP